MDGPLFFDLPATHLIQLFQSVWMSGFMRLVSALSDTQAYFLIVPLAAHWFYVRVWRFEALALIVVTAGNFLHQILKVLLQRPRPPETVRLLESVPDGFSFPSGHALGAIIFYGLLIYFANTLKGFPHRQAVTAVLMFFILLVGISRIYLGAHWASDVFAGYVLGLLWLFGVITWYKKYKKKYE